MNGIRDFVYLDVERVRSLVSQLEEGLVETVSKSLGSESGLNGGLKAKVFGLASGSVDVDQLWRRDLQENKSLHDYIYTKLETQLLKIGALKTINSSQLSDLEFAGSFKSKLKSTDFVLIHSNIEIDDLSRMRSIVERFNDLGRFLAWTSVQGSGPDAKAGHQKALKAAEAGVQIDKKLQEGISLVIRELLGDKVIFRAGRFDSNFTFVGTLEPKLLREDMHSLQIKYGSRPTEPWHVFCQVASLQPNMQGTMHSSEEKGVHASLSKVFDSLRQIDRVVMPYSASDITITPIAVYRQPED